MYTTKKQIERWLLNHRRTNINSYKINDDLSVDITNERFTLALKFFEDDFIDGLLPVKFRNVGSFNIPSCGLRDLKSSPDSCYNIDCSDNLLESLQYCPVEITSKLQCSYNFLTSLEHVPQSLTLAIYCDENSLTSLVFARKKPISYENNPCTKIYNNLGFTTEAHIKALLELDPNPCETLRRLKPVHPERYRNLIKDSKELSIMMGEHGEELKQAYDISKNVEGDFY